MLSVSAGPGPGKLAGQRACSTQLWMMEDETKKPGAVLEIDTFGTCISFSILQRGMDLLIALPSFLSALYTYRSPVSRNTMGAISARRSPTSVHAPVRADRTGEFMSKKSMTNRVARLRYASLGFRGFLWRKCESTKPSQSPTSVLVSLYSLSVRLSMTARRASPRPMAIT